MNVGTEKKYFGRKKERGFVFEGAKNRKYNDGLKVYKKLGLAVTKEQKGGEKRACQIGKQKGEKK